MMKIVYEFKGNEKCAYDLGKTNNDIYIDFIDKTISYFNMHSKEWEYIEFKHLRQAVIVDDPFNKL